MTGPLQGARIGLTANRRAEEQAALVTALGGVPRQGSSVDLDRPVADAGIDAIVDDLIAAPPDVAVFMTGVGARHILAGAARGGRLRTLVATLASRRLVARGGKPKRVLREYGLEADWTAVPAESRAVVEGLVAEGVRGRRIVVQCAGDGPEPMTSALRSAGARVREVHPYTLPLPGDDTPAVILAREALAGGLDAITFTSARAVEGFAAISRRAGVDLGGIGCSGVVVTAVGPVTREALIAHGLPVHVEPETPRMGAMFHALAAALAGARAPR
ncbi:MAG: uroporphyrinogen-III synthase [Thermoleophilia bacterium]